MTQHLPQSPPVAADVVERDDGAFQIGWHDDAAGPFPNRSFAQAVAEQRIVRLADRTRQIRRAVR